MLLEKIVSLTELTYCKVEILIGIEMLTEEY
jgi:hypothetical protein